MRFARADSIFGLYPQEQDRAVLTAKTACPNLDALAIAGGRRPHVANDLAGSDSHAHISSADGGGYGGEARGRARSEPAHVNPRGGAIAI